MKYGAGYEYVYTKENSTARYWFIRKGSIGPDHKRNRRAYF